MAISTQSIRQHLQAFDFKSLFVESTPDGLGWNNYTSRLQSFEFEGVRYTFTPIAEQGGMVIVQCESSNGNIPSSGARSKIDKYITELAFEHIIIFVDGDKSTSLWLWVKHEDGKTKSRTHPYRKGQLADALLQKLAGIAFDIKELDEEGKVSIAAVTGKVKKAFDVETITKKFYEQFDKEHSNFLKFLQGVQDTAGREWYASVMLNRLMFLYFIQRKEFLDYNNESIDAKRNYLRVKLEAIREEGKNYYKDFLLKLFFDGLACEESERTAEVNQLLGKIPYLNGGLFLPHEIEENHKKNTPGDLLALPNEAFVNLFNFFDRWDWHLDVREHRAGNEINPDVLGYIFEKYINQREMGAYYTKEDITEYICKNTILPFLLNKAGVDVKAVMHDVEPYIYDAVSTTDILPTETEREYAARRKRYEQIKADFATGKIASVNDLVTYNLNIIALTEDWLRGLDDPSMLGYFYFECLTKLTVLDPTCGSGAFLFAAMKILEPLYELALDKMRRFADPIRHLKFYDELQRVNVHSNARYFVFKSIIVNNLYGVDIMQEAVEICKLRLFLKLVAEIEDVKQIEPLPDIDFNIRAGNTLVGFATQNEISGRLFATPALMEKVKNSDRALSSFRELQTRLDKDATESHTDQPERLSILLKKAKKDIQTQLNIIRDDLDQSLMEDYGQSDLTAFRKSHQPFHWYVEFNHVMANGGFDVIVGNPPYVEYSKVKKQYTLLKNFSDYSTNLYSACCYRSHLLKRTSGYASFIVPVSLPSTDRMKPLRLLLAKEHDVHYVAFSTRPAKLFEGAEQRLTIYLQSPSNSPKLLSGGYLKWATAHRENLFPLIEYVEVKAISERHDIWPKVRGQTEKAIFEKLVNKRKLSTSGMLGKGGKLYYKNTGLRYFNTVTLRPPRCWINGTETSSSRETILDVKSDYLNIVHAYLLSTTFFMYWQFTSNSRDLNPSDILLFPVSDRVDAEALRELSLSAEVDYVSKGKIIKMQNKLTGLVELESLTPARSKPIIDNIDRVLAQHYGFTDEELDFIINYDIKYRIGKDAESDDAEADDA